jgi:hypothetical protein
MTGVDGWAVASEQVSRVSAMHVKRGNVSFPFSTKASARPGSRWLAPRSPCNHLWLQFPNAPAHPGRNLNHDGTAGQPRWSPQTGQQRAHSAASLFSQPAVVWQEPFLSVRFLGGITEKNARGRASAVCGRAHHVVLSGELKHFGEQIRHCIACQRVGRPRWLRLLARLMSTSGRNSTVESA